ncbi:MAG: GAF domain-containing protein, partial [Patulibacter sp.]
MINTQSGATAMASDIPAPARAGAGVPVVDTVEAFGRVGLAIAEGWESERVLRLITALARRMASSERGSMYLREGSTERFRGRLTEFAGSGTADDARVQRLVCGGAADRFTQEIVASRAPVLISHAQTDRRPIHSTMRAWDIDTIIGVPMLVGDRVTGLLFLDELTDAGEVDSERLETAAAIGRFAGVAVAQVDAVTALRGDLSALGRQNRLLRQSSAVEDRFAKLALAGPELEQICTLAGELSHKPCVILDAGMRQLAANDRAQRSAFLESCRNCVELADAATAIP